MADIPAALRAFVTRRAKGLCEYCLSPQRIGIDMEVDHVIPESAGGLTAESNLCRACYSCNRSKGAAQNAVDPISGQKAHLFNPRTQNWAEHFQWDDTNTRIVGLTPTARATIIRLKMNREAIVEARALWVQAGWHPPK